MNRGVQRYVGTLMPLRTLAFVLFVLGGVSGCRHAVEFDSSGCDPSGPRSEASSFDAEAYEREELARTEWALLRDARCSPPTPLHDEDKAFDACDALVRDLPPEMSSRCRHVCVVKARADVARRAVDQVIESLRAAAPLIGSAGASACVRSTLQKNPDVQPDRVIEDIQQAAEQIWRCAGGEALPRGYRISLNFRPTRTWPVYLDEVQIEGWNRALKGRHVWALTRQDFGCGASGVVVTQVAP